MASPFVWHELLTSDAAVASAFYAALFGWQIDDATVWIDGRAVAGVRAVKLAPHWAPFVRVADVEAAARAGVTAGGRVAGRPSSPAGVVLVDPRHVATVACADFGDDLFAWHLLESTDVEASAAWLAAIAGFTAPPGRGLWREGEQIGSLVEAPSDRWLGHVMVQDRLAIRARACELGGRVERADVDVPGQGHFDVLCDPQGAPFCAFQAA